MQFSTRLSIVITALFLVSMCAMFYLGYASTTGIIEKNVKEQLEGQAFQIVDKIDRTLFERYVDMGVLATDSVLRSRTSTPEQITQRLGEYQGKYRIYSSLSFFNMNRVRLADTSGKDIGKQHALTPYWREIAGGRDMVMAITESQATKQIVIHFVATVKDRQGRRFGVVASRMPIESIHQIVDQTFRSGRDHEPVKAELLDANGLILYSSYHGKGMLRDQSSDWEYIKGLLVQGGSIGSARHAFQEEEEITAFARERGHDTFRGNGWVLTLCVPVKTAFAAANAQAIKFISLFLAIGVIVILSTFLVSRAATKPLHELSRAVAEIGKGSRDVSIRVRSNDEIGQLAQAVNAMVVDLGESEKKYRDLAELLPQIVYEIDEKGKVAFANHYGLKLFGYAQDDLDKGLNAMQMFIPEDRDRVSENLQKGLRGEQIEGIEYIALRKDGSRFPMLTYASPIIHENKPVGMRGIGIDITERKKAEEALRVATEFSRSVMDSISDNISVVDVSDYRITGCNAGFLKKLGLRMEEVIGRHCYELSHSRSEPCRPPHDACPLGKTVATGKYSVAEHVHFFEAGKGSYVEVTTTPVFNENGKVVKVVHVVRDITERKQAEEDIRRLNAVLELKVEERTKQLVEAQEALVRKEKLSILGQLSASVGHELRNPLGVISNAVYFLKTVLSKGDAQVLEYLNIIKSEVETSLRIISDLLDFSRTRPPQAHSVSVAAIISKSLGACTIPGNVTLVIDLPETLPLVKVDPIQLGQVFQNLIMNAVQAMPEGGSVRVSARRVQSTEFKVQSDKNINYELRTTNSEVDAAFVEISVVDTGEGITTKNMKDLFQPFFTTKARGIGLGLSVSKRNVEANGGRIEVKSQAGKGTAFYVHLPVAA